MDFDDGLEPVIPAVVGRKRKSSTENHQREKTRGPHPAPADPWYIHTKTSHSLYEGWKTWLITKQRKNQPPPAPLFSSTYARAYEDPLPVKKEKYHDLMSMLAYMPVESQAFYETLECEE
ncbi:hypothetical protein Q8A67_012367 [Cirrhinus molitorella]|uniref:Uncharacterized protein n=1 Tax=Cirrhinus molitorella TaxID=172907 RepID=A0AA88PMU6_9TELE|nr:hypothetical protein Q8A67_012367 [Cirrhinus molitorella]